MGRGQKGVWAGLGLVAGFCVASLVGCSTPPRNLNTTITTTNESVPAEATAAKRPAATTSMGPSLGGAAVVPRAGVRCEGEREDERGLRCLIIHRSATATECRYEVTTEGFDDEGRPGVDVEVTVLNVSSDGSFDYRYESRGHRQWPMGSRTIEVESMIGARYREDASGHGRCPTPAGDMVECERRDAFIIENPCTTQLSS